MNFSKKAIVFTPSFGSAHGGALSLKYWITVLVQNEWYVEIVTGINAEDPSLFKSEATLTAVKVVNELFDRKVGNIFRYRMFWRRAIRECSQLNYDLCVVCGDRPSKEYLKLQKVLPLLFVRQDNILTCPAGVRYLPRSKKTCDKPIGVSCFIVNSHEGCMAKLGIIQRMKSYVSRVIDGRRLNKLDNFVANSGYTLMRHGGRGYVLYPPIKSRVAQQLAGGLANNLVRDRKKLIFIGRLEYVKGPDLALQVLSQLPEDYSLVMFGNGPMLTELKRVAAHLGLAERVEFHGWCDEKVIFKELVSAGLLLVTSRWDEAFGKVGPEAMLCGTPVVAFDVGGVAEWCQSSCGVLVQSGNVVGMVQAVLSISEDEVTWRKYSLAATNLSQLLFDEAKYEASFMALIEEVCEKFSRRLYER